MNIEDVSHLSDPDPECLLWFAVSREDTRRLVLEICKSDSVLFIFNAELMPAVLFKTAETNACGLDLVPASSNRLDDLGFAVESNFNPDNKEHVRILLDLLAYRQRCAIRQQKNPT